MSGLVVRELLSDSMHTRWASCRRLVEWRDVRSGLVVGSGARSRRIATGRSESGGRLVADAVPSLLVHSDAMQLDRVSVGCCLRY